MERYGVLLKRSIPAGLVDPTGMLSEAAAYLLFAVVYGATYEPVFGALSQPSPPLPLQSAAKAPCAETRASLCSFALP